MGGVYTFTVTTRVEADPRSSSSVLGSIWEVTEANNRRVDSDDVQCVILGG